VGRFFYIQLFFKIVTEFIILLFYFLEKPTNKNKLHRADIEKQKVKLLPTEV